MRGEDNENSIFFCFNLGLRATKKKHTKKLSAIQACWVDIEKHRDCSVILWNADKLFILTTKTEERYTAKANKSQYLTQSFTQKVVLLFAFDRWIDLRVKVFDSRNAYLWHPWQVLWVQLRTQLNDKMLEKGTQGRLV